MTYNDVTNPSELDLIIDRVIDEERDSDSRLRDIDPNTTRRAIYYRHALKQMLAARGYIIVKDPHHEQHVANRFPDGTKVVVHTQPNNAPTIGTAYDADPDRFTAIVEWPNGGTTEVDLYNLSIYRPTDEDGEPLR